MKKNSMFFLVALLALVCLTAVSALAVVHSGKTRGHDAGKNEVHFNNTAIRSAIESGDYNSFMAAIQSNGNSRMAKNMTEAQFEKMVSLYKQQSEKMASMQAKQQQIQKALQNDDFNSWSQAVSVNGTMPKFLANITADNFAAYAKLEQAIQSKDFAAAKNLSTQLGLKTGFGPFMGARPGNFTRPVGKLGHMSKPMRFHNKS